MYICIENSISTCWRGLLTRSIYCMCILHSTQRDQDALGTLPPRPRAVRATGQCRWGKIMVALWAPGRSSLVLLWVKTLVGGFKHVLFSNIYIYIYILYIYIWDNLSHWLIFFKMGKTTNQNMMKSEHRIRWTTLVILWFAVHLYNKCLSCECLQIWW